MLFGNFLFFFPFSSDIFILIFSLIKAAKEVVKNAKKFITLTGGWIFTEKFTNSIKLQSKKKWKRKLDLAALKVGLYMYRDGLEIGLTLAFMSTNRSSSSARRTDAVPLNSFITGRYLKGRQKKNEVKNIEVSISSLQKAIWSLLRRSSLRSNFFRFFFFRVNISYKMWILQLTVLNSLHTVRNLHFCPKIQLWFPEKNCRNIFKWQLVKMLRFWTF